MIFKKILALPVFLAAVCFHAFPSAVLFDCAFDSTVENESEFSLSFATDFALLGTGILLSGSDLVLDNIMHLNRKEYDGETFFKDDVNPFDRFFMHGYSKNLHFASTATLAALVVSPALLVPFTDRSLWLTECVMYAETLLIANGIKEITKLCVTRIRPYMYYSIEDAPSDKIESGDFANSFMSGHTAMAFASASFLSCTFCTLFPESSLKIPVVAGSFSVAALTAAFRVLGGNHFATDVIAGAVVGSSVGFLVPLLHKKRAKTESRNESTVSLCPLPLGFSICVSL